MSTPWRRDSDWFVTRLTAWARSLGRASASITDVVAPGSGMANDTVLFRLDGDPLVARLAPDPASPYATFPTYDFELQRQVIEVVRCRTDVPVPEIVHVETSENPLGVPFMVTRMIDGVVASDTPLYLVDPTGWFRRGTPEDWRRMETSTIDVLVKLHRVTDAGEDLAFLRPDAPGETALARQVAYQRRYYEWARDGHDVPTLERAFDTLGKTMPSNERDVLNWGDSRPGNIIYREFEPVAVLDWEMATVGPPEVDLAWTTFIQGFWAGMAAQLGMGPVPEMFGRAASVATYERLGGYRLDELAWYEAFAGLRFGIILTRMSLRSIAFGMRDRPNDPDDLMMFAPLLDQLLGEI